ncbi:MAG: hypothetical protein K2X66_03940 [Cyanobacteria bacterium]|nr:hypothetical protein [Cyanobacteriota bacterium]
MTDEQNTSPASEGSNPSETAFTASSTQSAPQNLDSGASDIVRALNNIYSELKVMNQHLAKVASQQGSSAPAPRSNSFSNDRSPSPSGDRPSYGGDRPSYGGGRPRPSGAAGRIYSKSPRPEFGRPRPEAGSSESGERSSERSSDRSYGGERPSYGDKPSFGGRPEKSSRFGKPAFKGSKFPAKSGGGYPKRPK